MLPTFSNQCFICFNALNPLILGRFIEQKSDFRIEKARIKKQSKVK